VDRERLTRLSRKQFGLFTRAHARACGYSAYQIQRRIRAGDWQVVFGSTLSVAGLRITPSIRDRAAQLSVPGSILAGPAALRTWRIAVPDDRPCLYVGRHGGTRVRGIRLMYETPDPSDVLVYQGLPATTLGASVVDCLRLLPEPVAISLVDRALQKGWLCLDELISRAKARIGRPGAPRLLRLVRLTAGGERAESERRLTSVLRSGRIDGWRANVEICDAAGLIGVGDVVFERERLVLEMDGWAFHTTPERFQRDRERQNRLTAAGWTVLRFTWRDVTERPDYVVASVRRLL
jgi:very-short-patch-repair endonuclease